jgi:putative nucleotidyltransferase with HDIG domain
MNPPTPTHLAEELLRRFAAAIRSGQLYSKGHPIISRNLEALAATAELLLAHTPSIVLGVVGDEIIVNDLPQARGENLGGLIRRLKQIAIERIVIERGATPEEIATMVDAVTTLEPRAGAEPPPFPALPHVRVGRVSAGEQGESGSTDMAAFRRLYSNAVSLAESIWDSAQTEGTPDATAATTMIDGLAQAVSQNRPALLALTTLKDYDNYTFTHMVNVSILTMGQARAIGIDGPLLREFGLAGLMHDIGKVRTPLEILNKPEKLNDDEFVIMRRHVVDGAEILKVTADMPALAPIVAFEHHMRLDGSGYPAITRDRLNLATMFCSISDVYDAMRSQRAYQKAFPTDRILEVLKRVDGRQFDQHLVRRFAQLIGIYPVGNLVRLDTGEIAVVVKVYAPDPHRPQVKVIIDRSGTRLEFPYQINLWELASDDAAAREGRPTAILKPVDPAEVGIDPLSLL